MAKLGYSVGFLIIVLGRHQLFTENTLTAALPFPQRRDRPTLARVLKVWAVVLAATLAGNIVGGTTLVAALGHAQVAGEARRAD